MTTTTGQETEGTGRRTGPAANTTRAAEPFRRNTRRGLDLEGLADEQFATRFWSKVDPTADCWEWTAHRKSNGYGQFTLRKGTFVGAHTVSYALVHGPISPGMSVCHRCDNPPCVNPDHLFLGTQSDNAIDMFSKGRASRSKGKERANAKLNDHAVREIRAATPHRGLVSVLAVQYGVSSTTIRKVLLGQKWSHVA